MSETKCPVCRAPAAQRFMTVAGNDYWQCARCEAKFLDRARLPTREAEYKHYLTHENDPADTGYRTFLSKLADPLLAVLPPGSKGLDYGCGPGPALAEMLSEAGHTVSLYDPFFHADDAALSETYDFIVCTETAEHFHRPADEFDKIDAMLRPDGWLGLMTSFQTDDARFAGWHYVKDPTHVVFYRKQRCTRLPNNMAGPAQSRQRTLP